eukprot:gene12881-7302_t
MKFFLCIMVVFFAVSTKAAFSSRQFSNSNCTGTVLAGTRVHSATDGSCVQTSSGYQRATCNSTHIISKTYTDSKCTSFNKQIDIVIGCNGNGQYSICKDDTFSFNAVTLTYKSNSNCTDTSKLQQIYFRTGNCFTAGQNSLKYICNSTNPMSQSFSNSNCAGTPTTSNYQGLCLKFGSIWADYSCKVASTPTGSGSKFGLY